MSELECPQCGGAVEIPPYSSTIVCPYCNTTIQTKTGTIFKEHYMMGLQYNRQDAQEKMFEWALKQLGAPEDLTQAEIVKSELTYWPFWVVEIEANATYRGSQKKPKFQSKEAIPIDKVKWEYEFEEGTVESTDDFIVPANRDIPQFLANYNIPIRRKDFFDQEKITDQEGIIKEIQVSQEEALDIARREMLEILRQEAGLEVESMVIKDDQKVNAIFLVEIPILHIEYSYGTSRYDGFVDGASGRIISLDFPRKESFRAMTKLAGEVHAGAGVGIILLLTYLGFTLFDGIFPTYFGIGLGLEMFLFGFLFLRFSKSLGTGDERQK